MTSPSTPKPKPLRTALADIAESLRKFHLIGTLGWQDVATRYRRSRIGAFWLTINMIVMIGALGLVFGTLFGQPMRDFLPFLAAGLVIWGFISSNVSEGCAAFYSAGGLILQVKMPLWVHIGRIMWKNIIIFAHNFLIIPLVFLAFYRPVSSNALLALPGFLLLIVNLLWMMMLAAILCARFRDLTQIVLNFLQVVFYLTPVIWNPEIIAQRVGNTLLYCNPFYSLVTIVRAPLLGECPSALNWVIAVALGIVGWLVAIVLYGSRLKRVPYWI
jgi:ABC-type polysaccharide/polyol phosphate export permease